MSLKVPPPGSAYHKGRGVNLNTNKHFKALLEESQKGVLNKFKFLATLKTFLEEVKASENDVIRRLDFLRAYSWGKHQRPILELISKATTEHCKQHQEHKAVESTFPWSAPHAPRSIVRPKDQTGLAAFLRTNAPTTMSHLGQSIAATIPSNLPLKAPLDLAAERRLTIEGIRKEPNQDALIERETKSLSLQLKALKEELSGVFNPENAVVFLGGMYGAQHENAHGNAIVFFKVEGRIFMQIHNYGMKQNEWMHPTGKGSRPKTIEVDPDQITNEDQLRTLVENLVQMDSLSNQSIRFKEWIERVTYHPKPPAPPKPLPSILAILEDDRCSRKGTHAHKCVSEAMRSCMKSLLLLQLYSVALKTDPAQPDKERREDAFLATHTLHAALKLRYQHTAWLGGQISVATKLQTSEDKHRPRVQANSKKVLEYLRALEKSKIADQMQMQMRPWILLLEAESNPGPGINYHYPSGIVPSAPVRPVSPSAPLFPDRPPAYELPSSLRVSSYFGGDESHLYEDPEATRSVPWPSYYSMYSPMGPDETLASSSTHATVLSPYAVVPSIPRQISPPPFIPTGSPSSFVAPPMMRMRAPNMLNSTGLMPPPGRMLGPLGSTPHHGRFAYPTASRPPVDDRGMPLSPVHGLPQYVASRDHGDETLDVSQVRVDIPSQPSWLSSRRVRFHRVGSPYIVENSTPSSPTDTLFARPSSNSSVNSFDFEL